MAAGKSRITVWSVLKLLFTLTLFVLVAAWISRWVERRLKNLEQPRAFHAHRHREVRQRLPDRPLHSHGPECRRRRSDRAHRADRRHRLGAGLRPAVDRGEFRQRLRAAHGSLHQAGRRHQPVGTERHQHGELRLGAGTARPLRGGARPRRRRDAGAESAADLQCRHQLELHRSAHPPQVADPRQLPRRSGTGAADSARRLRRPAARAARTRRPCRA